MTMPSTMRATGAPLNRLDGIPKVTGAATYAYEYAVEGATYVFPVLSTIARGRVSSIDASAARALPGVIAVLSHENAPQLAPLDDAKLAVFQSESVAYRGQFVAAVVAETLEMARQAAELVVVRYEEQPHDVELRADRPDLYTPQIVNPFYQSDTASGDVQTALAQAPVSLDYVYTTPAEHPNPLEPHTTVAVWNQDSLTLYDANQGPHPHVILAVMAAMVSRRPVKLALTRQQMFALAGYRSPTIQRVQLGAGRDGQLTAIAHDVVEQAATIHDYADPTAVPTRVMYAAPNRRTTHRLARLDVPATAWMRAPGNCPGMFALESAMDELAIACGLDPIELRIRNEPAVDPESGRPFSSRNLVACLREGAQRFGWQPRDPTPGLRRAGRWLIGTGVAASTYPAVQLPASALRARLQEEFGGSVPAEGLEATGTLQANPEAQQYAMHAFGAQFAEVRVNMDTGEVRVPRLLGVFAAGRIINPKTARSQLLGGMTWGLSMALHEESVLDPRFGDYVNHDFAEYHIATNADVGEIDVSWVDENDPHVNPIGVKGIGEIGIVGTAAAIANAVYHATGIRVRDLPITLDKLLR